MNIVKYEYKAHKLVKLIFHLVFFVLGFILGLTIDKASALMNPPTLELSDIKNLFENAQYLYSPSSNPSTIPSPSLNDYPYFICTLTGITSNDGLSCYFFRNYNSITIRAVYYYPSSSGGSNFIFVYPITDSFKASFSYNFSTNSLSPVFSTGSNKNSLTPYYYGVGASSTGKGEITSIVNNTNSSKDGISRLWSNIPYDDIVSFASALNTTSKNNLKTLLNSYYIYIDTSTPELIANAQLFSHDSNMKKVCVPLNQKFTLSYNGNISNGGSFSNYFFTYGFMSNPNYYLFKSNEKTLTQYSPYEGDSNPYPLNHYLIDSIDSINSAFSDEVFSDRLVELNYISNSNDLVPYYGWNIYQFNFITHFSDGSPSWYNTDVFEFVSPIFKSQWFNGNGDTCMGSPLEIGNQCFIDEYNENSDDVCLWISTDYDVNYLNLDEWGDVNGSISINGDSYNIDSDNNSSNIDSSRLFSNVNSFINQIKSTILFINTQIYNFYLSLPLIVRSFILALLVLSVTKIIIDMIVR